MSDTTFETWMAQVDRYLDVLCGLTSDDLADCSYHDWFDDGMTAQRAARKAIRENGGEG